MCRVLFSEHQVITFGPYLTNLLNNNVMDELKNIET